MTIRNTQHVVVGALAAVALLVAGVGMLLVVLPQHAKAGHIHSQLTLAESNLVALHTPVQPASAVDATDLFRLREAMPDADFMPQILVDLSQLAATASVRVTSVKPAPRVPLPAGYQALPMVVVVDGRYAALEAFLKEIREAVSTPHGKVHVSGRLFVVDGVSIVAPAPPQVEATLNLDAFDYGAPAPTTATAGVTATTGSTTTTTTTTTG